eukprot:TRINITY_DN8735_c0_g1_i1.p1 TRINITY_DN8735_c0_g1~~TRINITY_DN8735_c0_g1_i1.p1  ORF type:complete len:217 (+),score=20.69 TRINITY_DN8735_c0_g1_i1:130-780(+)
MFLIGVNFFEFRNHGAWHSPTIAVQPHSRRHRLLRAICESDLDEIKNVLDEDFDPNSTVDIRRGLNALSLAALLSRTSVIDYLLLRGANIDAQDSRGNTALMVATINWNFEAIKLLVNRGADITIRDKYGYDAIDKATSRRLFSIAHFFRQRPIQTKPIAKHPDIDITFSFEEKFKDQTDQLFRQRKFFTSKPRVYPFNDFKGLYVVDYFSSYLLE